MSVIEQYLQNISEPQKSELSRISNIIKQQVPDATEAISYGMPGYKYKNKYLITFSAFSDHMSIFPGATAIASHKKQLAPFKTSKGTVQFTLENPLSDALLKEIVQTRRSEIDTSRMR